MGKKKIWLFGTCTIVVLLFISFSFYEFYLGLQRNETSLQQEALQEVASRDTTIFNLKLDSYINSMHSIEEFIKSDHLTIEHTLSHLKNTQDSLGFESMGISSLEGTLYMTDGSTTSVSNAPYFPLILQDQIVFTDIKSVPTLHAKQFTIAIPLKNEAGIINGALFGIIDPEDFQACNHGIDEAFYIWGTYIIDENGNFILAHNNVIATGSNLLDNLQEKANNISKEDLQKQLLTRQSFTARLTINNQEYLAIFSPLKYNNWYNIVAIPMNEIHEHSNLLLESNIYPLMLKIFFAIGLLSLLIIYYLIRVAKHEEKKGKQLIEGLTSGVIRYMEVDLETNQIFHSAEDGHMKKSMDIPFSDYLENLIDKTVHPDYKEHVYHHSSPKHVIDLFQKGVYNNVFNFLSYNNGNSIIWIECETHVTLDEETGHLMCYYILRNITDKKREERNLKEKAEHDALTGLYNRGTATDLINQFLSFNTDRNLQHAFIIIDLDNFKNVNDKLGHKTGDTALQEVSKILSDFFRKEDIICRLGGDEFVIFLKFISVPTTEEKLKQLLPCLRLSYKNEEQEVQISGSIGVAFAYDDGSSFKDLYQAADQALYQAKEAGKDTYRIYMR